RTPGSGRRFSGPRAIGFTIRLRAASKKGQNCWFTGAGQSGLPAGGNFVGPAVLTKVRPEMRVAQEGFGPVLSVDACGYARGGHRTRESGSPGQ
ncbi:MAG: aldehyde dehydrogenase family protein, partial [Acidobacteria bacterium]|nr:aldehyde dehydrogenase family protein [Acidobacteriota bacterium]